MTHLATIPQLIAQPGDPAWTHRPGACVHLCYGGIADVSGRRKSGSTATQAGGGVFRLTG